MKKTRTILTITMVMLLCMFCTVALQPQVAFAKAASTNVTTSCDTKNVKEGQTVKIKVSTKKMSVSTFVASVEYDGDLLEYKGYEGTDKKKQGSVYLTKQGDSDSQTEVSVEKNENAPIIGMYSVGVKEVKFAASEPLVTLVFEAKADGSVEYVATETSDGEDGFTSETVLKETGGEGQYTDDIGVDESSENSTEEQSSGQDQGGNFGILIAGLVIVVLAIVIVILIIKRRK